MLLFTCTMQTRNDPNELNPQVVPLKKLIASTIMICHSILLEFGYTTFTRSFSNAAYIPVAKLD